MYPDVVAFVKSKIIQQFEDVWMAKEIETREIYWTWKETRGRSRQRWLGMEGFTYQGWNVISWKLGS